MVWPVTADVRKFDAQVDWFRARTPMTDREFKATRDRNHDRAFTIAHVNDARVVETVHQEIDRAIAEGLPFDDFKKRIKKTLGDKHGIGGSHLETVFRNATQSAYNTGRWYQMTDPALTAVRPYWLLDVTLDSRTSNRCRPVANVCKAHDDPWWLTNWPPRHHRCRTTVRSVRRSEAERVGITTGTPAQTADKGFGYAPPLRGADDDEPAPGSLPPAVEGAYRRKKATKRAPPAETKPTKKRAAPKKASKKAASKKTAARRAATTIKKTAPRKKPPAKKAATKRSSTKTTVKKTAPNKRPPAKKAAKKATTKRPSKTVKRTKRRTS